MDKDQMADCLDVRSDGIHRCEMVPVIKQPTIEQLIRNMGNVEVICTASTWEVACYTHDGATCVASVTADSHEAAIRALYEKWKEPAD